MGGMTMRRKTTAASNSGSFASHHRSAPEVAFLDSIPPQTYDPDVPPVQVVNPSADEMDRAPWGAQVTVTGRHGTQTYTRTNRDYPKRNSWAAVWVAENGDELTWKRIRRFGVPRTGLGRLFPNDEATLEYHEPVMTPSLDQWYQHPNDLPRTRVA